MPARPAYSVGELELALLRVQLLAFQRKFCQAVGPAYYELDEARAQAAKLRARFHPAAHRESRAAREQALATAAEYAQVVPQANQKPDAVRIKLLHRSLALAFHPDRSSDDARRTLCERLMAEINHAVDHGDLAVLELLTGSESQPHGDAAKSLADLTNSPLNKIRERVESAARRRHDLLAELRAHILMLTASIRDLGPKAPPFRLSGDLASRGWRELETLATRACLVFPDGAKLGQLFVRERANIDAPLRAIGPAAGVREVPAGSAVILRLGGECTNLEMLRDLQPDDLHGMIDEWPDFVALNDEKLQALAHFSGIEVIQLGRTAVTGRVFDHFVSLRELRVLILDETQFDDAGLLRLANSVWMQRLDLSFTAVRGPGLAALRNMASLRDLSLYGTSVQDADLKVLRHITGLRNLNLGLTGITYDIGPLLQQLSALEVLNLGGTAVTDALVSQLTAIPSLRELVLWETKVSGSILEVLATLPKLSYLDVDQTQVGTNALAAFRRARPDVRLPGDIWDGQA